MKTSGLVLASALAPLAAILVLAGVSSHVHAEPLSYAIVIGNNAPPDPASPQLKYADDDAARFAQLFQRFTKRTVILTVPDKETRVRYPELAGQMRPPTLEELRAAVALVTESARKELANDNPEHRRQLVLYVTFSGHGSQIDNEPYLALERGRLTQKTIEREILDVVAQFPNSLVHLFLDACNAEAVVGVRGADDVAAETLPISPADIAQRLALNSLPARYSNLGILLATTAAQKTHEWSRIESGVFAHELLSGLAGAADINGDGVLEYSEILAFVNAANGAINDPRIRATVQAYPPKSAPRVPLVSRSQLANVGILTGDFSPLGRFFITLASGERYLDAHLQSAPWPAWIAVPGGEPVKLLADGFETELNLAPGQEVSLDSLDRCSAQGSVAARGTPDAVFTESLFRTPFGRTYYQGVVDSLGLVSVTWPSPDRPSPPPPPRRSLIPSLALLTGSAVSLAASVWQGSVAWQARHDYDSTQFQRPAFEAADRYGDARKVAIWTAATSAALGFVAWLVWPSENQTKRN
jgi:hypothetical protein